jgi:hypothetical protein
MVIRIGPPFGTNTGMMEQWNHLSMMAFHRKNSRLRTGRVSLYEKGKPSVKPQVKAERFSLTKRHFLYTLALHRKRLFRIDIREK